MVAINDRHAVSQMKGYKRTVGDWGYDIVTEHQIGLGGSDKRTTCSQSSEGVQAYRRRDWGYDDVDVH